MTPDLVIGNGAFATNVGFAGQAAFLFSDMLGNRNLLLQAALYGDPLESTLIATYYNQSHRTNWALSVFQFRDDFGYYTASNTADFRSQIFRGIGFGASRPFNTFTRMEVGSNLYFVDDNVVSLNFFTGAASNENINNYMTAAFNVALIRDSAFWGIAAPISGTRARLSAQQFIGDLQYLFLSADYRKYIPISIPRYTIAYRLSGGMTHGENNRLFGIGGPYTFRGVDWGVLRGTRAAFQNVELRFPMFPYLPMQYDFLTGVAFFDAANVWGESFFGPMPFDFNNTYWSYGLGIRFNLGGLLVLRWDFPFKKERGQPSVFFSIGLDY
jgi:outer membrane protein assembly factor BamA